MQAGVPNCSARALYDKLEAQFHDFKYVVFYLYAGWHVTVHGKPVRVADDC